MDDIRGQVKMLEKMGHKRLLVEFGEDPENKLVFFSAINNVKFRKLIEPGDQIIFEIELVN